MSETLTNDATEAIKIKPNIGNYNSTVLMFLFLLHACLYVVIKAERVSNDSVDKGYIFPDKNDNLSTYAGGNAQLMVPAGLLQDISKSTHRLILQILKYN